MWELIDKRDPDQFAFQVINESKKKLLVLTPFGIHSIIKRRSSTEKIPIQEELANRFSWFVVCFTRKKKVTGMFVKPGQKLSNGELIRITVRKTKTKNKMKEDIIELVIVDRNGKTRKVDYFIRHSIPLVSVRKKDRRSEQNN